MCGRWRRVLMRGLLAAAGLGAGALSSCGRDAVLSLNLELRKADCLGLPGGVDQVQPSILYPAALSLLCGPATNVPGEEPGSVRDG